MWRHFFTMNKNKTSFNIMRIWHYLSIYFSNLYYLNYLGFLQMFLLLIEDCFFSKLFKILMLFFSQLGGHQIEFVSTIFKNKVCFTS
jgi:hypothetical protein